MHMASCNSGFGSLRDTSSVGTWTGGHPPCALWGGGWSHPEEGVSVSTASARDAGHHVPGAAEQGQHAGRCAQHLARAHPVPIMAVVCLAESMRACVAASSGVHCCSPWSCGPVSPAWALGGLQESYQPEDLGLCSSWEDKVKSC